MAKKPDETGTPPYLPWTTFINFLRQIKTAGAIPTRIDSTVLKGRSGTDQSGIKTALRFLSLIGPDDAVTQNFRDLIGSMDGEHWKRSFADLVTASYLEITHAIDLDNGTLGELQQAFTQRGGVSGSVRDKAVRFYLSACREAGFVLSPHFGPPPTPTSGESARRAPRARRPKPSPPTNANGGDSAVDRAPTPEGTKEVRFPLPGKTDVRIWLPETITDAEWGMVDTYLRAFISLSRAGT